MAFPNWHVVTHQKIKIRILLVHHDRFCLILPKNYEAFFAFQKILWKWFQLHETTAKKVKFVLNIVLLPRERLNFLGRISIWMSHWCRQTTDGAKFWISWKRLKVSKFQNENMKSSHFPKSERKNLKNSALSIQGRIFQIFRSNFGQWDDFIFSF